MSFFHSKENIITESDVEGALLEIIYIYTLLSIILDFHVVNIHMCQYDQYFQRFLNVKV